MHFTYSLVSVCVTHTLFYHIVISHFYCAFDSHLLYLQCLMGKHIIPGNRGRREWFLVTAQFFVEYLDNGKVNFFIFYQFDMK